MFNSTEKDKPQYATVKLLKATAHSSDGGVPDFVEEIWENLSKHLPEWVAQIFPIPLYCLKPTDFPRDRTQFSQKMKPEYWINYLLLQWTKHMIV